MTASESIALAISQIDEKKQKLKKAFDDLQAHRSLLSPSFNLSWSDIDSHFSSLQSSLSNRFLLLQSDQIVTSTAVTTVTPLLQSDKIETSSTVTTVTPLLQSDKLVTYPTVTTVTPLLQSDKIETSPTVTTGTPLIWPELRNFCENMDGKGLGKFMVDNTNKRLSIKPELPEAIRSASNPAVLVLDAIEGSYHSSPSSSARAIDARRIFVLLLEALVEIKPNLTNELRERARTLANDWRLNIGNKPSEALGFLHLVVVFDLVSVFKNEEILDYVFLISKCKQATTISKKLGLDKTRAAGLIQKFLNTGRLQVAISFIYEFEMTDRFRPVTVLKTSLRNSREAAKRVCAEGGGSVKAQNEATDKELAALRLVMKIAKEKDLEDEFYEERLEECVRELENLRDQRRQAAANLASPAKHPKRPRVGMGNNFTAPTQSQQQQPLLPDPRHGLQVNNPYGFVNSTVPGGNVLYNPLAPYESVPPPGVASRPPYYEQQTGNPLAPYGSVPPPGVASRPAYYEQQNGYGGYGLRPQYQPPYYPQ